MMVVPPAQVGSYDIICGRDSAAFNNIGNRRFRVTIGLHVQRYVQASSRRGTKVVIQSVYDVLTQQAGARFLKRHKGGDHFVVMGERDIRNKIQHALRDTAAVLLSNEEEENRPIGPISTRNNNRSVTQSPVVARRMSTQEAHLRDSIGDLTSMLDATTQDDDDDVSISQLVPGLGV